MDRHQLHFGPYRTPRFRYAQKVECEARGEVTITGLSAARIPWPIGQTQRAKSLVLFKDLAHAVRRESKLAIQHWWGVGASAVWKWRRALGVVLTEGDRRLLSANSRRPIMRASLAKAWARARDPVRRAKIAAARRGKPRPDYVVKGMRQRQLGKRLPATTRRRMSEAHKRRGTRPPAAGRAWEQWEDDLLDTLPAAEVTVRTGRTIGAIRCRRSALGLPDRRTRDERRKFGRSQ